MSEALPAAWAKITRGLSLHGGDRPMAALPDAARALMAEIGPKWGTDIQKYRDMVLAAYAPLLENSPKDGVTVTREHAYGPHERHRLDVFRPDGAERALLTLIEGAQQDIELVLHSRSAAQRPHHPATTTVAAARRRTMAVAVPVPPLSPTNRQEIHP